MSDYAVQVAGISKHYGDFVAVGNLSFDVPKGVIYGILGPNGAGKTTTLRMLNDILLPDSGKIELLGNLAPGAQASKRIGYLPEERGLYPKMKVGDTLEFFGELRGLTKKRARVQSDMWLERLKIPDWKGHRVQDLSKGMQQKVQFATALIHDPELLILDEPWSGLDPINAEVLKEIVLAQREAGRTILFSTHLMGQAEEICEHVCIIARGRKAVEGRLETLKNDAALVGVVELRFQNDEDLKQAQDKVLKQPLVERQTPKSDGFVAVQLGSEYGASELLSKLVDAQLVPQRFEQMRPSLHQIFVDRVGAQADNTKALRNTEKDEVHE